MTDLSPSGRAHLRKNARIYGDEVLVDVLDALEAALLERDELRETLISRALTEPDAEPAPQNLGDLQLSRSATQNPESSEMLRSGNNGL